MWDDEGKSFGLKKKIHTLRHTHTQQQQKTDIYTRDL